MIEINDLTMYTNGGAHCKYTFYVETDETDFVQAVTNKACISGWQWTNKIPLSLSLDKKEEKTVPEIKDVIFNDPATIIQWSDGSKTIVKVDKRYGDKFNKELGLAMAICKKAMGNKGNFNEVFKKFIWEKED